MGTRLTAIWELCGVTSHGGRLRRIAQVLAVVAAGGLTSGVLVLGAAATELPTDGRTDGRQVFPPATTPDNAEVSVLSLEVSRIEFSLANLDGTLIVTDGSRFRLDADVLFRFDSAELSPKAADLLTDVARQIRSARAHAIRVDGYTDDTGDAGYNLGLSRRRAAAVAVALRHALGPDVRMRVAGHGEAYPVADNETTTGQARNRRVTVAIVR